MDYSFFKNAVGNINMQAYYETVIGERATYRKEGADYHTLRYVRWLEDRLDDEIKWGHRHCTPENCVSSGVDCPADRR